MEKKLTSIIICWSIFVLQCVNVFAADVKAGCIDLDTLNDIIQAESIEKNVSENSFAQNNRNIILQFRANAAGLSGANAYALTVTYRVSLVREGGA